MTPGSLPLSTELYQEGTIIPPLKLARRGRLNREVVQLICRNSRTPDERKGDLAAQFASIRVGGRRGYGRSCPGTTWRRPWSTWIPS